VAGSHAGFGVAGKPDFWIGAGERTAPKVHVAFRAKDRATVRACHGAALAAGAADNGPPGLREIYHPAYYGAFVLDPDGHNIEAVPRARIAAAEPRRSGTPGATNTPGPRLPFYYNLS
jgi:catechol 2,3-dioxygenase-like lactoylglutathione lyase family enzyme